jgi:hypothetical protein
MARGSSIWSYLAKEWCEPDGGVLLHQSILGAIIIISVVLTFDRSKTPVLNDSPLSSPY